jgi:hypothetical protein
VDVRPALVKRLARAIAAREGCVRNPGCLKYAEQAGARLGRAGYAEWPTKEEGFAALERHIEKRWTWTIREIAVAYNRPNVRYAEMVLKGTGLDGRMVIAEQTDCEDR